MYMVRTFHPGQSAYCQLQTAVSSHFHAHHGASPNPCPDQFWCLTGRDGQAPGYACMGLSWGDSAKLFSEYYLDGSLTEAYGIQRPELVELGQLSSFGVKGAGRFLLTYVLRTLAEHRYRCVVLTATSQVRRLLDVMHVQFDDVGAACMSRVRDKHIDWGTYYRNKPRVIMIDLERGLTAMVKAEWEPTPHRLVSGRVATPASPPMPLR